MSVKNTKICTNLSNTVCNSEKTQLKNEKKNDIDNYYIGSSEEAPEFMCHNAHIKKGYRINFNSYWKLSKSLFMLHNETINVWSHIIGMLIFFYLVGHTFNRYEPSEFYYHSMAHNNINSFNKIDFGVPTKKMDQSVKSPIDNFKYLEL